MRDRSLDEFLDGVDEEPVDETPENGGADAEATSDAPDDEDADAPAQPTVRFDPAGATCAACGEMVQRRWRQDGELVCGTCKSW
ncbi:hypothetical protein [Halosegnis sp.]|uniref:DUF7573 domain-containing protein n=1 Tax=Halosegnis sp. TaxID=2864959 RepID=UPI0035D4030E